MGKRDTPDDGIASRDITPTKSRLGLRGRVGSSGDTVPPTKRKGAPNKSLRKASSKKAKKIDSSGKQKRNTARSQRSKEPTTNKRHQTQDSELQETDPAHRRGQTTGRKSQENRSAASPVGEEADRGRAEEENGIGLADGLRDIFDFHSGNDERRRDLIWQKMVTESMHIRSKLEEASTRLRESEEKNKTLEKMISDLRQNPATLLGSTITQDSFSNERSKTIMTQISVEWLLCIGPTTVCPVDDDLCPFESPFLYCHWSPLVSDPEKYLASLRKAFILKMLLDETRSVADGFDAAFYQQKPVPGLKTVFSVKRRQIKSDRIAKKVLKFLDKIPGVTISDGCEWRLDGADDSNEENEDGSKKVYCSFFTRPGSADLFDTIFMRSSEYKNYESEPRRFLSITQLALMDSHFILKYNQIGQTERDFREVAQGTDKDTIRIAKNLAEKTFEKTADRSNLCRCCLLVDLDGPPPIAVREEHQEDEDQKESYDTDHDGEMEDIIGQKDSVVVGEESEEGDSDEENDEDLSYMSDQLEKKK